MINLMNHQRQAVEWLQKNNGRGLIWGATGVGKSFIALAYASSVEEEREKTGMFSKVLIIVPASVKLQWASEMNKFINRRAIVITGTPTERAALWNFGSTYYITNYENLLKDYKYILSQKWDLVVCDEAHRLANARAKSVKIIKKIPALRRVGMSATFISNGKHDLFSPVDWIKPGALGKTWWDFRSQYCVLLEAFPKIVGYRNQEQMNRIIAPLIHEISKDVLTDLPPLSEVTVPFELSSKERKVYDQIKEELRIQLLSGEEIHIPNALVAMTRLRQATNTCAPFGLEIESSKLETLVDLLGDLLADPSNKVIMFTSFAQTAKEYYKTLSSLANGALILGETDQYKRYEYLERFNNDPGYRFILGTEALSTGLNIQAANIIIHIDSPFSWAKLDQRNGRAWRKGQTKPVVAYSLEGIKTIDQVVHRLVLSKKEQAYMTAADIRELLE